MSVPELAAWATLTLAGLLGSAAWSGLETALYSVNRVALRARRADPGDRAAAAVDAALSHPQRTLSTILIGNNACNYAGTLGMTALIETWRLPLAGQIALQIAVLSPLLLVFGEVLPKDVMRVRAEVFAYRLMPLLTLGQRLATLTLVLPLIEGLARLLTGRNAGGADAVATARERLLSLLHDTASAGVISAEQAGLAERAMQFERTRVRDVMAPWSEVVAVREAWSVTRIRATLVGSRRSRCPVLDARGGVVGIIEQLDLHLSPGATTAELVRPAVVVRESMSLREALALLRDRGMPMGVVLGPQGRPAGLVTPKDLIEPLTGPLSAW